ncbi:AAA family ATPase [Pontibacter silvestris]|uniref:AAA family ATPase n=1 Tax=Pontibacter silvestris TaxID=2305183 RepID=A0ABW4X0S9_9BACT|nr:AAA family ATPase [Pontibacter silvestris]MCC9135441.1 AAA family ATPase [Pontibacter silvestris]
MKILAVRFQNLNSLKGEHEIRFDQSPLSDAGLFAITGPTGAGKTTILDAMTVGLYGLVHRHNQDKPLELMTRHTAESYAEVEFEAKGKRYRSKWHLRRSRGKADGNIQPVHMELYDYAEDALLDLKPSQVPDKVAELSGLDYNQFLRSVMLSQGDFARFLKANPNERSSLLEKITDTGIYSEISKFAFEKAKAERLKREDLEHKLQDNKLLPEEERKAYEASIAELTGHESILGQETARLQEQIQWLTQVQQLQAKSQQHLIALQTQEQKLESLQPDFKKLQQHEQAQQYESQLTRIELANGQLVQVQSQLDTLKNQLPVLEAELELAGKVASEAGKVHHQQEEALQKLEPLLEKVNKLDHQLHTIREQYQKEKAAYVQFGENHQQEKTLLETKQQSLDKLTQEATNVKNWLQEHERLQDLSENLHVIKQSIKDLQEVELRIKRCQQEQQELQKQLQQETLQQVQLTKKQQENTDQKQIADKQKKEKIAQLQTLLADRSIDDLEQSAQEHPLLLARYEKLLELAKQNQQQKQKVQGLTQQLIQQESEVKAQQLSLTATQQQYTDATERLKYIQKLVLLQQQIQKYEEARHMLQPGQPCPLCGSEQHPFVESEYNISLPEEVQKRDTQQALVTELQQSIHNLNLQLSTLQQRQQLASTARAEAETEVKRLQQAFAANAVDITISIEEAERLEQLIQQQKQELGQLQQKLVRARAYSKELESMNQQGQQLREAQLQLQSQLNQLEQSRKYLKTQLEKLAVSLEDEKEQQQAHTETVESIAATFGLLYKAEKRQELLHTLEQQAAAYVQKQQNLEKMRTAYVELNAEVKSLNLKVQEKQQELKARQENLKEEHLKLSQLKEERVQLFGEKDPQQERLRAHQELKAQASQAEEARTAQLKKQQELQESRQRQQEYQQTHHQNKSLLDELREGLLRVLQQQGIETIEALSQMLINKDEATRLANLKNQAEKHLTELRKSLSDVQHELAQVKSKDMTGETGEALRELHQEKTKQQHELIAQRARYQQLLEQDTQQREKNRELAEQLRTQQQVCHRWEQLSSLIGSADGNKFSRFAQGLTLARLVELANRHLQKLNDRYRILKSSEEDLELLIVDTYQAEAVRPMNTLSGGESFLVSLALALGLSDLAGRRTQINSLFIDEGFGTLDAETLDAAISTLENLQASGKMIGIISHVEALKERISTQIRVKKQAGGVSKVEVVGW